MYIMYIQLWKSKTESGDLSHSQPFQIPLPHYNPTVLKCIWIAPYHVTASWYPLQLCLPPHPGQRSVSSPGSSCNMALRYPSPSFTPFNHIDPPHLQNGTLSHVDGQNAAKLGNLIFVQGFRWLYSTASDFSRENKLAAPKNS